VSYLDEFGNGVNESGNVAQVKFNKQRFSKLYDVESADGRSIRVNVNAVVGKNGAGKSTLIELLFAVVFAFSNEKEIIKPNSKSLPGEIERIEKQLETLSSNNTKALREVHEELAKLPLSLVDVERALAKHSDAINFEEKQKKLREVKEELVNKLKDSLLIKKQLRAEVYYEMDNECYRLRFDESQSDLKHITRVDSNLTGNHTTENPNDSSAHQSLLFYTIAVNYSHYALNSVHLGGWISTLFHKNDGYKTPVVINPMRTLGNFDINKESQFAKYRLLANVLVDRSNPKNSRLFITDNQYISKIRFTLDHEKIRRKSIQSMDGGVTGDYDSANLLQEFLNQYFSPFDTIDLSQYHSALKTPVANYIIDKVWRISETYEGFEFPWVENLEDRQIGLQRFVAHINDDYTHITFKLKQALNFFKHSLNSTNDPFAEVAAGAPYVDLTPDQLINWMEHPTPLEIINNIPPAIFKVDFILGNKDGGESHFNDLSSGEQQLIHSVQSVMYHLNNLQSIHNSTDGTRIKYHSINIVFDEIELYFHPEFQRRFLNSILLALRSFHLGTGSAINAINLLFLTHSPFILSDIPSENILLLYLDERTGRSNSKFNTSKTFAADIHDLLADSFFIKDTLMGAFAEKTISNFIESTRDANNPYREVVDLVGDKYLEITLKRYQDLRKQDTSKS
jgi:predicted ATP-binding protein involved in virulence